MARLETEDIRNLTGSDLVIVYGFSHVVDQRYFSDDKYRFMGPTGSGKSNLIDTLTNQTGQRASSKMEVCTTEVRAVRLRNHKIYGNHLVLVDTPGFDGTNISDLAVLELVSQWLQKVCEKKQKLAGIVYLYRITDNRMAGNFNRNSRMLGKLCGDRVVNKVAFVTTMWDKGNEEKYKSRERDLLQNYWKKMIEHGVSTDRFSNTLESAWRIIDTILKQQETEILPLIEEEVERTSYTDLQKRLVEQRKAFYSLLERAQQESNWELTGRIESELKRIQQEFDQSFQEIKPVKIPFGKKVMSSFFGKKAQARS